MRLKLYLLDCVGQFHVAGVCVAVVGLVTMLSSTSLPGKPKGSMSHVASQSWLRRLGYAQVSAMLF